GTFSRGARRAPREKVPDPFFVRRALGRRLKAATTFGDRPMRTPTALALVLALAPLLSAQQLIDENFGSGLGGQLGTSGAADGDVDNDGRSDLILGAPFDSTHGTSPGGGRALSGAPRAA